ncbi:MAG: hypothetical protein DIJKHBIC_03936 [Thermoanaerobaculia bacterium]|nr:hypothetical protein [Thermoanaerobaculia bacterium]
MKRILNSHRPRLLAAIVALSSLGFQLPTSAANLLSNGSFSDNLSSWSSGPEVSWSDQGNGNRGAARVSGTPGIVGTTVLTQCVPVEPFAEYDLSASVLLPYSSQVSGGASLRVTWYASPGCASEPIWMSPSLEFPFLAPAAWTRRDSRRLAAPTGAASASISVLAYSGGSPGAFGMFLDEVEFARSSRFETLTIPTAASVDGAWGERFQTSLVLKNPAPSARRVDIRLHCAQNEACSSALVSLYFAPDETRVFSDVMLEVFGKRNFAGALPIGYDAALGPVIVSARAKTVHSARPGNGTALPVLPASSAVTRGIFTGLLEARGGEAGTRVNAGVFNPNDSYVWINFPIHGEDGNHINTLIVLAAPRAWLQINDIFAAASAGGAAEGSTIRFTSEAPVYPFLIAIDSRSGDPSWIEIKEDFQP